VRLQVGQKSKAKKEKSKGKIEKEIIFFPRDI
jgi:hypothetical protein